MRLYIIRHGDPDYSRDALTARGEREAAALAEYLPHLNITHIYCSPLGRAQATMAPCVERLGLVPEVLPWTRELTGVYYEIEGFGRVAPFTVPGEVMYRLSPEPKYRDWMRPPYFNDSRMVQQIKEMEEGSDALLARHGFTREGSIYHAEKASEDRVAVFCHQGLGTTWIAHLLHLPYQAAWAGLWQPCASFATIVMERRSQRYAVPRMIGMGETPHIDLNGLDRSEFGLAT